MIAIVCIAAALLIGLPVAAWAKRWSRRTAARLIYGHPACECGDALPRHAAQEGMCLDCDCFGWTPQRPLTVPPHAGATSATPGHPPEDRTDPHRAITGHHDDNDTEGMR